MEDEMMGMEIEPVMDPQNMMQGTPPAQTLPTQLQQTIDGLSESEKEEYEEYFGDPTNPEAEGEIPNNALNKWLFNSDTVDKILESLMEFGIKVEGGDKLGKSIIFAKNCENQSFSTIPPSIFTISGFNPSFLMALNRS